MNLAYGSGDRSVGAKTNGFLFMKFNDKRIEALAVKHGIRYRKKEDKYYFEIDFLPQGDFEWHSESVCFWFKQLANDQYNWWRDVVYDCRHQICGPGYGGTYAVIPQKPKTFEEILVLIESELSSMSQRKQVSTKWR